MPSWSLPQGLATYPHSGCPAPQQTTATLMLGNMTSYIPACGSGTKAISSLLVLAGNKRQKPVVGSLIQW